MIHMMELAHYIQGHLSYTWMIALPSITIIRSYAITITYIFHSYILLIHHIIISSDIQV